jgi:hypothetical protein
VERQIVVSRIEEVVIDGGIVECIEKPGQRIWARLFDDREVLILYETPTTELR